MSRQKISKEEKVLRAKRLAEARAYLRVTQKEFSSRLGLQEWHIRSIESGRVTLLMELALAIERVWSISSVWLLTGEGPMLAPPPLEAGAPNGDRPHEPPRLYTVIEQVGGRATVATEEEIALIHKLLRILRSEDPGIVSAITANLTQFERLSKLVNAQFGDIILLERRVQQLPQEEWPDGVIEDRRKVG